MTALRAVPALLWAIVIFILCTIPGQNLPAEAWMEAIRLDKWVHFGIFAVLMVLVSFAIDGQYEPVSLRFYIGAFLLVVAFGALIEGYQHFMLDDRYAELYDVLANTIGALAGGWFYKRYCSVRLRQWRNKKSC